MARKFATVANVGDGNTRQVLSDLSDVVCYITGQTQTPVKTLAATATTAEIISKINEILNRLQGN